MLDGVDGWLARAHGLCSEFGEYFDKETDALLALSLCWALVVVVHAPWWSLVIGLWRFGFVLMLRLWPPTRGYKETRSRWGPAIFVLSTFGLLLALSRADARTESILLGVAIIISASFLHALWSLYRA